MDYLRQFVLILLTACSFVSCQTDRTIKKCSELQVSDSVIWQQIKIPAELARPLQKYCGGMEQYRKQLLGIQQALHDVQHVYGISPSSLLWLAWSEHNLKQGRSWLHYDDRARAQVARQVGIQAADVDHAPAAQQVRMIAGFFARKVDKSGVDLRGATQSELQLFIFAPAKYAAYQQSGESIVLYVQKHRLWKHVYIYDRDNDGVLRAGEFLANAQEKHKRDVKSLAALVLPHRL